jgi:Ser/Thr protein kinase RdoA (MazF antagonist)
MHTTLTAKDLNFAPPAFSESRLAEIAAAHFGIRGALKRLHGERDQNVRITDAEGRQYVLKISGAGEDPRVVDFQVRALAHIAERDPGLPVPRLVPALSGDPVIRMEAGQDVFLVRLMTYLPGVPFGDGPAPSLGGLRRIGAFLARLNRALSDFTHPAAGHFMPWDLGNGLVLNPELVALLPAEIRPIIEPVLDRIEAEVYPKLSHLRAQVIHQDGHGGNLLRENDQSETVTGVIDFGDMVHGPLINDLAVSASHFLEGGGDQAAIAGALCGGFHSGLPLEPEEIDLLPDLVLLRQILTLQLFEFRRRHVPGSPAYVTEEQPMLRESIRALALLNREGFSRALRAACDNRP